MREDAGNTSNIFVLCFFVGRLVHKEKEKKDDNVRLAGD